MPERRTRGQYGFAQRDDDEQLAPLGQVAAIDGPVRRPRPTQPRHREAGHRRQVFAAHRQQPKHEARTSFIKAARDPKRGRYQQPAQHPQEVGRQHMATPQAVQHEQRAPHLDRREAAGEQQAPPAEGFGNGGRHQQRHAHQHHQHGADDQMLGIEPVADPGGVLPAQPDREPQRRRLQHAQPGQVLEQVMGQLGDGEDIDQVEEQFDVGHAGGLTGWPQQGMRGIRHDGELGSWSFSVASSSKPTTSPPRPAPGRSPPG